MAEVKFIVFALGRQKYGMKLSRINGIEYVYNVVPVPMGAPNIKGIIHLREQVVPVYNLKSKFGITEDAEVCNRQLLLAETHGIKLGFEVDDVLGIVPVPEEDIKEVPNVVKSEETVYLDNVVKLILPEKTKEEIIISISVDRIMTDMEFEGVSSAIDAQNN